MTIPEVRELFAYWRDYPPTHELMRLYIGYKPPVDPSGLAGGESINPQDMAALLERSGGRIIGKMQ